MKEVVRINQEGPLFSIIITNYNYGRYIEKAIDSCLSQTYKNIEIIVVDDGSTDNSKDICRGYGDRIRLVERENGGQAAAFNTGYKMSRGDLIWFLDSDDWLNENAVESISTLFNDGVAMVSATLMVLDSKGNIVGARPPATTSAIPSDKLLLYIANTGEVPFAPTSGNIYAKRFLAKAFPVPEKIYVHAADAYINRQVPFFGRVVRTTLVVGYYRKHPESLMSQSRKCIPALIIRIGWEEESFAAMFPHARRLGIAPPCGLVAIHTRHLANVILGRSLGFVARYSAQCTRLNLLTLAIGARRRHAHQRLQYARRLACLAILIFTPPFIGRRMSGVLFWLAF